MLNKHSRSLETHRVDCVGPSQNKLMRVRAYFCSTFKRARVTDELSPPPHFVVQPAPKPAPAPAPSPRPSVPSVEHSALEPATSVNDDGKTQSDSQSERDEMGREVRG